MVREIVNARVLPDDSAALAIERNATPLMAPLGNLPVGVRTMATAVAHQAPNGNDGGGDCLDLAAANT